MTYRAGLLGVALMIIAADASAATPRPPAGGATIPDQYIVELRSAGLGSVLGKLPLLDQVTSLLSQLPGGRVLHVYERTLHGIAIHLPVAQLPLLQRNPLVVSVRQDLRYQPAGLLPGAWGLDRIDQAALPLDGRFAAPEPQGSGVDVYVIDTGIAPDHAEFQGRVGTGRNFVAGGGGEADSSDWRDCNGHGTSVASVAAGGSVGVAPRATVHAVRVMGCDGSGAGSDILAGIEWVLVNARRPAVVNLSMGTVGGRDPWIEQGVQKLERAGFAVAVAAGNEGHDACDRSPAAEPSVLTVGATGPDDSRASFSNFGRCVDLFAPGVRIASAWPTRSDAYAATSGTSIATPHVTGALAVLLSRAPRISGGQAQAMLLELATRDAIGDPRGTPNRLLYLATTEADAGEGAAPAPAPPPARRAPPSAACPDCAEVQGHLDDGSDAVFPSTGGFDSGGGRFVASLRIGGAGAAVFLEKLGRGGLLGLATVWRTVAGADAGNGGAELAFDGGPGTYRWRVAGPEGGAAYEFRYNRP